MQRTVYLKTTDTCNLNCSHCFTGGNQPDRYFWNIEKTKDWIQRYMEALPVNDTVYFEFHGGEPMLAPLEQLIEVYDFIRTFGHRVGVGITTNLVYKLTDEMLQFFVNLDGFGSSWDPDIRFANDGQLLLWRSNMGRVSHKRRTVKKSITLHVSVSKKLTELDQESLLLFYQTTGATQVLFDRITMDGNATQHHTLFPSNQEINNWYLKMHEATVKRDARRWFRNAALEDVYAKFENNMQSCGTFCRDCEERLFTVSANGNISGCPNSAAEETFGTIDMSIQELMMTSKRIDAMANERTRNEKCFECPVFSYCGSDCHRLAWDGDICASPRELMKELAGIGGKVYPVKKVIPISAI